VLVAQHAQQRFDQHLARAASVLHHRRQRRMREACGGNIVESYYRHLSGYVDASTV
jgi:hypothetical protein